MKKLLLAFALFLSLPAFSAEGASEASIRELMKVTDAKQLLDASYAQMDGILGQAMKQATGDAPPTAKQQVLIDEFKSKTVELMRKEMSWEKLEPAYLELYAKTFSQSEIDGMLAFYKSEPGRAVLAKMPQLMANMSQTMMTLMQSFLPAMQKLAAEYVPKVRDAGK
ncbi:MAG TPA: DUF2059 domain-containing protein [Steroidobacteraceae bacterium]|nr:DUF2059 domain-containing protein [Steroidobacteraceae bacterium]